MPIVVGETVGAYRIIEQLGQGGMVAKLDHPNIVPIFDFSEYEGRPYLVMKYIEGETDIPSWIRNEIIQAQESNNLKP